MGTSALLKGVRQFGHPQLGGPHVGEARRFSPREHLPSPQVIFFVFRTSKKLKGTLKHIENIINLR